MACIILNNNRGTKYRKRAIREIGGGAEREGCFVKSKQNAAEERCGQTKFREGYANQNPSGRLPGSVAGIFIRESSRREFKSGRPSSRSAMVGPIVP